MFWKSRSLLVAERIEERTPGGPTPEKSWRQKLWEPALHDRDAKALAHTALKKGTTMAPDRKLAVD